MLGGYLDDRAADPNTVAAIGESFQLLLEKNKPDKSYVMEKSTYDMYVAHLSKAPHLTPFPSNRRFSNRGRFRVLYRDDNTPYLARASTNKRIYHRDEIFDVIFTAHCSCNHGDGKKTYSIVKEFADNIFHWECVLVTKLCYCKRVKKFPPSELRSASKPMTKAGDIHLFNMESNPDKDYQWILLYRDDLTKFLFARPLRSRDYDEIMLSLFYIFLDHGAPLFLNTSLSKRFILKLLDRLYAVWPECPTIYGQQLPSDNHTEFMRNLEDWMKESQSKSWTIGAAFVTAALNSKASITLGSAPYTLMHRTTLEQFATKYHRRCDNSNDGLDLNDDDQDDFCTANQEIADEVSVVEVCRGEPDDYISSREELNSMYQNSSPGSSSAFPISEADGDSVIQTVLISYLSRVKIINNPGRGDCLFFAIRQHLKVFTLFEYKLNTLRTMVAEFLCGNHLGQAFVRRNHPDVDVNALSLNTGTCSSWGGPETILAISQLFHLQVTVLSYIRKSNDLPYISKYWPLSDVPPSRDTLSEPSNNHMVLRFEDHHYTLLLPYDLEYPPRRFKRERS